MNKNLEPNDADHTEMEMLLPWYVNGTLDERERAMVDAYIAAHPEFAVLLAEEYRLRDAAVSMPVGATAPAQPATLRSVERRSPVSLWHRALGRRWIETMQAKRRVTAAALQAAMVIGAFFVGSFWYGQNGAGPPSTSAEYHTLSAPESSDFGKIIVAAQKNTSEADFRLALTSANAVIIDGPTEAGAYIIRVPKKDSEAMLSLLQKNKAISLAQPIDGNSP